MKTRCKRLLAALAVGITVSAARADTFYTDDASWVAAVNSVAVNAVTDPAPSPYVYLGYGTASVTYGPVTYSMSSAYGDALFYNVGSLDYGFPAVVSAQFNSQGVEDIMITLSTPVNALALNYGTFFGDNVNVQLSDGNTDVLVDPATFNYSTPNFIGVISSSPISSILLTTTDPTLDVGNVYTAVPNVAVPEPSAALLLALPLAIQFLGRLCVRKQTR